MCHNLESCTLLDRTMAQPVGFSAERDNSCLMFKTELKSYVYMPPHLVINAISLLFLDHAKALIL